MFMTSGTNVETRLYNLFLSEEELKSNVVYREGDLSKNIQGCCIG